MRRGMLTPCLPGWSLDRIATFAAETGYERLEVAVVVDRLYEAGFAGTLSVEHEDPLWAGTDEKITEGLRIAQRTLRPLVAA